MAVDFCQKRCCHRHMDDWVRAAFLLFGKFRQLRRNLRLALSGDCTDDLDVDVDHRHSCSVQNLTRNSSIRRPPIARPGSKTAGEPGRQKSLTGWEKVDNREAPLPDVGAHFQDIVG